MAVTFRVIPLTTDRDLVVSGLFVLTGVSLAVALWLFFADPAWRARTVPRDPPPGDDPPRPCSGCGRPVGPGDPEGLCPQCLLKAALPGGTALSPTALFIAGADAPPVEEVARLFPHLEVKELIGQGGMGAVYLARQPALDRLVALKLVRRRRRTTRRSPSGSPGRPRRWPGSATRTSSPSTSPARPAGCRTWSWSTSTG